MCLTTFNTASPIFVSGCFLFNNTYDGGVKTRGEKIKGIRMKPDLIAKIEGAKALSGIENFSDRVRYLIERSLETEKAEALNSSAPAAQAEVKRRGLK